MKTWEDIYNLEITQQYPDAIVAIEERLQLNSSENEAIIRLGFLLWLGIVEKDRLELNISQQSYAKRFRELLNANRSNYDNNADFCFSFGYGLSIDYFYFVEDAKDINELKSYESIGKTLLEKAMELDPFYSKLLKGEITQKEISEHFVNRGCILKYYGIV